MADIGVSGGLTGDESEVWSLGGGWAPDFVRKGCVDSPVEVFVCKIISCNARSITGLCGCNYEYPRMADIGWAGGVSRNLLFWFVPLGNATSRVVACTIGP